MCTHTRLVLNKYTHRMVRVSCGKCKACQQEKANKRANRIRLNHREGMVGLFVTLTYSNEFVPYVDRYELTLYHDYVSVWRDASVRMLKDGSKRVYNRINEIDYVFPEYDKEKFKPNLIGLKHQPNKVGVIYYKDLQDFIKRLRINILRHYGKEIPFSYFACGEYGGQSYRPHFHLLIFADACHEATLRNYIYESWPYDSGTAKKCSVEVARDAASYVASYVNSNSALSPFLASNIFRQKHSYSRGFGMALEQFSLNSILSLADDGAMQYRCKVHKDGYDTVSNLPIPKYVIDRYFPKFKGYTWTDVFTFSQVFECSRRRCYVEEARKLPYGNLIDACFVDDSIVCNIEYIMRQFPVLEYTRQDAHEFLVRQRHAIEYYIAQTGKTYFDYLIDYQRVWTCYASTLLKLSYLDDSGRPIEDFSDFYENANELYFGVVHAPTLEGVDLSTFTMDANSRNDVVVGSDTLSKLYNKKTKCKNVVNLAMSQSGYDV